MYVYRRSGGVWNIETQLLGQCASTNRRNFGRRIAFDGTRAMIGGVCPPTMAGGPSNDVGVEIATRQPNGTWTFGRDVYSSRMGAGGWDNGLAIIGNPTTQGIASDTNIEAGFVRSALFDGTTWIGNGPSDNGTQTPTPQGYGYGLSVDNGLLAIASFRANTPIILRRRSGNNFLPEASLAPAGLTPSDVTRAVAVRGNRVAIGAQEHTVSVGLQGAVFVFEKLSGSWQQTQRVLANSPEGFSQFGSALLMAENNALIVGAPEAGDVIEGKVYIYTELLRDGFE